MCSEMGLGSFGMGEVRRDPSLLTVVPGHGEWFGV
jgi:hypothetical protein